VRDSSIQGGDRGHKRRTEEVSTVRVGPTIRRFARLAASRPPKRECYSGRLDPSSMSVPERFSLKAALKRGALLTAANWQIVIVQFVTDATFKLLLAVPMIGGAFLVAVLVGGDGADLVSGDLRVTLPMIAHALYDQPFALAGFLVAFGLVLAGGSMLMFLVKGGTVATLVLADRTAGPIERAPITWRGLMRAAVFSLDGFTQGCARFFRRYLRLGLLLVGVYVLSAACYFVTILGAYWIADDSGLMVGWTLFALLGSSALIGWITIVNLLYLLTQIVTAAEDVPVRVAVVRVAGFLRAELREVAGVFGIVLMFVVLGMAASIVATAAFGLVAFVPLVWLAALPLQAAAWILRGLLFQYLSLTALAAYLKLYRTFTAAAQSSPLRDAQTA
jgi:hypothetical protein